MALHEPPGSTYSNCTPSNRLHCNVQTERNHSAASTNVTRLCILRGTWHHQKVQRIYHTNDTAGRKVHETSHSLYMNTYTVVPAAAAGSITIHLVLWRSSCLHSRCDSIADRDLSRAGHCSIPPKKHIMRPGPALLSKPQDLPRPATPRNTAAAPFTRQQRAC